MSDIVYCVNSNYKGKMLELNIWSGDFKEKLENVSNL